MLAVAVREPHLEQELVVRRDLLGDVLPVQGLSLAMPTVGNQQLRRGVVWATPHPEHQEVMGALDKQELAYMTMQLSSARV